METDKAKQLLKRQIEATNELSGVEESWPEFQKWKRDTEIAIEQIFGRSSRHLADFRGISYSCGVYYARMPADAGVKACHHGLASAKAILQSMTEEIDQYGIEQPGALVPDGFAIVGHLCEKFHLVLRQLRHRHDNRNTLKVEDEYDAQDLLHALLYLHFDDIRDEEWTPSYAGGSSRMDFLLKQEKIVIEVKKTRKGLGAKEVGEQLIVDIQKYQAHQDCKALICFVYDSEGWIANPRGLENDLNGDKNGIKVRVIVAPKGTLVAPARRKRTSAQPSTSSTPARRAGPGEGSDGGPDFLATSHVRHGGRSREGRFLRAQDHLWNG